MFVIRLYYIGFIILLKFSLSLSTFASTAPSLTEVAESNLWRKLLYYNTEGISRASSPQFFVTSPRHTPLQELKASLELIEKESGSSENDFACRFPARFEFLTKSGLINKKSHCPIFQAWLNATGTRRISLVYAAQYASNPGSAFGHTFFLLESEHLPLYLNFTISYAADMPETTSAIDYVMKGLGGGFLGRYFVQPFYKLVHIYNNIEDRDVWIYPLNLSAEELNFYLKHIWEIKDQFSAPYYFMTANCAGVPLESLEVIRPEVRFWDDYIAYIPPPEMAKTLKKYGFIDQSIYRPSASKLVNGLYHGLSYSDQKSFKTAVRTKKLNPANSQNINLNEALIRYLEAQRGITKGKLKDEDENFRNQLLDERSQMDGEPKEPQIIAHPTIESHGPWLARFGGMRQDNHNWMLIGGRPTLHNLLDRENGYNPFSSLEVLDTSLLIKQNNKLQLHHLNFINIENYRADTVLGSSYSYKIKTGLLSNQLDINRDEITYNLDLEIGKTFYLNSNTRFFIHTHTPINIGHQDKVGELSLGGRAGLIVSYESIRFLTSWSHAKRMNLNQDAQVLNIDASYDLKKNLSLIGGVQDDSMAVSDKYYLTLNYFF